MGPIIEVGLPERHRERAARLYLEAFGRKIGPIIGTGERAARFLAAVLSPRHAIVALDEEGGLLGLAGYHDETGGFVGGGFSELADAYGRLGALWRAPALMIFERKRIGGQLLMDGVVVADAARGRGVGGALIERVARLARETGRREVRLDVIDANPRARALYERRGFRATAETGSRILKPLFGFERVTTMVRAVSQA